MASISKSQRYICDRMTATNFITCYNQKFQSKWMRRTSLLNEERRILFACKKFSN